MQSYQAPEQYQQYYDGWDSVELTYSQKMDLERYIDSLVENEVANALDELEHEPGRRENLSIKDIQEKVSKKVRQFRASEKGQAIIKKTPDPVKHAVKEIDREEIDLSDRSITDMTSNRPALTEHQTSSQSSSDQAGKSQMSDASHLIAAEEEARQEAAERAREIAEREQAAAQARRLAEEEARREAAERAREIAEREQAAEQARRLAEEEARQEAAERAREIAEREQAEELARRLAEEEARQEAMERAQRTR